MLGYYNLPLGSNVHCIDVDPHSSSSGGAYEDTRLVEKFRMSEEEYDRRKGTLRDWGRQKKESDPKFSLKKHAREHAELVEAKRFYRESGAVKEGFEMESDGTTIVRCSENANDNDSAKKELDNTKSEAELEHGPDSIQHLSLHSRCQVKPGSRRGEIAFVGSIDELGGGGHWVGVILDEPMGKTDGTARIEVASSGETMWKLEIFQRLISWMS